MKKSTKWVLGLICVVLVLGIGAGVFLITQIAPIATAYGAKRLCSCVFISHREATAVLREELKPYGYVHLDIDHDRKKVTGSILGLAKSTAVYREGLGCTLAIGVSEDELRSQALSLKPIRWDQNNRPWPEGDQLQGGPLPAIIDSQKLKNVMDRAFAEPDPAKPRRTRAVIVLYDGRIIAERYAAGFTRETPQLGWSMTKSVTNALVGVLVKEGKLRLRDPAPVPEWRSPGDPRAAITLDELMRMSSGLRFKEDYKNPRSDAIRMLLAEPDAGAYAAEKPLEVPPNSRWSYSSGTANIISRIVRQSVGGSLADFVAFAHRALFDRVGMAQRRDRAGPIRHLRGFILYVCDPARLGKIRSTLLQRRGVEERTDPARRMGEVHHDAHAQRSERRVRRPILVERRQVRATRRSVDAEGAARYVFAAGI